MSSPTGDSTSPLLQLPNVYRAFYGSFAHLYPFQKQAIEPILQGCDLILQSATGSGKTEAVLAPCVERMIRSGREEAILYVVPTRALAIDLERRLDPVLRQRLGLQLGVRTGDLKRAGGARPDLLLTTPESFDVALGSSNPDLQGFTRRVRTVVIDEVHPLVHSYRGQQLAYLLQRLERRKGAQLQKIALSATIADAGAIVRFFSFRPDAVPLIASVQREIVPHLVHLKDEESEIIALLDDLYEAWGYRKVLIFANSRSRCDRLFALLNHHGSFRDVCGLHYSNLKPKERRGVERRFREREHALCIATSTLELGIDIGDVDGVLLYEPSDSVSTFLQRIGRSNRRQRRTHFWGICRGEQAGRQLLRFLGLLRLARQGSVESPLPKNLPSVLIQQFLSCLYEKKRISLPALQELFLERREDLERLFPSLVQQGWLRQEKIGGLFRGGRRYRDCFLERRIWSNFPESEEDYALELAGEAIADLPRSVVRQLEAGDRVQLAGKRLQVLQIDTGERKRVIARPADLLDDKDLFWLGAGFRVSFEVAQAIRELLKEGAKREDGTALGLFTRTRRLLQMEMEWDGRKVLLANGIEVGRGAGGLYRYRTFLGSLGNLMLRWTIENDLGHRLEDLTVAADEVGLDCSHRIDFRKLHLPADRAAFHRWVERHVETLSAFFPLNAFCAVLPPRLLVEELTDFLFDPRLAESFCRYLKESSDIVEGDPAILDQPLSDAERDKPTFIDTAIPEESLLAWEKRRWGVNAEQRGLALQPEARHRFRALTGTLVGEYIRHQQCQRWISFSFLPVDQRPPMRTWVDADPGISRMEQGRQHEAQVLEQMRARGEEVCTIEEHDGRGRRRPLRERFEESFDRLKSLVQKAEAAPEQSFHLSQGVLLLPSVLDREDSWMHQVNGVGIPDLIRVSMGSGGVLLEVGDIKDSRSPHDSQKWQVAFYALLLRSLIRQQVTPIQAEVSASGFLIIHPIQAEPEPYSFDLHPYMDAFPALLQNMGKVLWNDPSAATYRLQSHCTTCPYFDHCYREALQTEEVLFLPQLTAGALEHMRKLGLKSIEAAEEWFERGFPDAVEEDPFSPSQRQRLKGSLAALRGNRIGLRDRKSRLFPANLSLSIFVHLVEDPLSGLPRLIGWRVLNEAGTVVHARTWIAAAEEELAEIRQEFADQLLQIWRKGIGEGKGPHIFHFGERSWQGLQAWGEGSELDFLWAPGRVHRTDLRRLLAAHFDLPAPGTLTLFACGRLLGLEPALEAPESLLHADEEPFITADEWTRDERERKEVAARLDALLALQAEVWRWASFHLESEWVQREWEPASGGKRALDGLFLDFLEEEKRLREEDILTLQEFPLPERAERFRAIGPLMFSGAELDDQGRFLYGFQTSPEVGLSKFREGDFLKLAPVGTPDLQSGFPVILADYHRHAGRLWARSRRGRLPLNRRLSYSLEEDLTDWNAPKLIHAARTVFSADHPHPLARLFSGNWSLDCDLEERRWMREWLREFGPVSGLNPTQRQALGLPFRHRLSLIEGPPGTGKTHLLGWILIALVYRAREAGRGLRIVVSALTHQAIDQVLKKVVDLVERHELRDFPGQCLKWGRWEEDKSEKEVRVEPLVDGEHLAACSYPILGATGFGLYQLFQGQQGEFPQFFDWVVFDEASQVLVPQALISLLYGKGNFLFSGDVKQLPPIVLGDYEGGEELPLGVNSSILAHLQSWYPTQSIRLDQTYRMNEEICAFPSRTWYDDALRAAEGNAHSRLVLKAPNKGDLLDRVLDPEKPVTLLLVEHRGCHQKADLEVEIVAELAYRLLVEHGLGADQLALISPHRAQNNATADYLGRLLGDEGAALPLIDTVERVQGAERDVILFAFTTSDADHVESEFLNNPNRFNVAITRARKKLIVVGSRAFFSMVPRAEEALRANSCFKAFYEFCREREGLFFGEGAES